MLGGGVYAAISCEGRCLVVSLYSVRFDCLVDVHLFQPLIVLLLDIGAECGLYLFEREKNGDLWLL